MNFQRKKQAELYEICHISHLLKRRTNQLSGGEKQRIALARLLGSMPRLLLLDEPFSNFDAIHKKTMRKILDDISKRLDISIIMVSHDAMDILSWADSIVVLQEGKVIQQGTNRDVYLQPINEYCAALLGDYSLLIYGRSRSNR
jgi:ABC-type sulfate/molybdate transport systems ATPase subunit